MSEWQPIDTAPRDGSYILVAGDSGYTTTPLRVEVCRFNSYQAKGYEVPVLEGTGYWVNHANDRFTDGGKPPKLWMPLPKTCLPSATQIHDRLALDRSRARGV